MHVVGAGIRSLCRHVACLIFVRFPGVGAVRGACLLGQCRVLCTLCLVRFCGVHFETPILPFLWRFLRLLATCWETCFGPVAGFPAVRVGAVERGGELSCTLDTSNLWVCCRACLWVLLWWFGWRGDQTLGWETLGMVEVWAEWLRGLAFWSGLGRQASGFLCRFFSFWGLDQGRESRGLMAWGDFWCAQSCALSCFLFYLYDIIILKPLFSGSF